MSARAEFIETYGNEIKEVVRTSALGSYNIDGLKSKPLPAPERILGNSYLRDNGAGLEEVEPEPASDMEVYYQFLRHHYPAAGIEAGVSMSPVEKLLRMSALASRVLVEAGVSPSVIIRPHEIVEKDIPKNLPLPGWLSGVNNVLADRERSVRVNGLMLQGWKIQCAEVDDSMMPPTERFDLHRYQKSPQLEHFYLFVGKGLARTKTALESASEVVPREGIETPPEFIEPDVRTSEGQRQMIRLWLLQKAVTRCVLRNEAIPVTDMQLILISGAVSEPETLEY